VGEALMRGRCQYPALFTFRCDDGLANSIRACLDPGVPESVGLRELFEHPLIREALRQRAACAAAAALQLEARRG
jgi:hypothetical protein